jgi:hypothetical protein
LAKNHSLGPGVIAPYRSEGAYTMTWFETIMSASIVVGIVALIMIRRR